MFDRFGEFDSAKGINETAVNLRREGDNDSIYALARENGIDREMVDAFVAGDILYICDAMSAAIGKISVEEQELKPKEIMADWTEYIRSEAFEDESMAIAVRRKGKSLKGCIAALLQWAFAHQTEISPDIVRAAGIKAGKVTLGEPGMATAKRIIRQYYKGEAAK